MKRLLATAIAFSTFGALPVAAYPEYAEEEIQREKADRLAIKAAWYCIAVMQRAGFSDSDIEIIDKVEDEINQVHLNIIDGYGMGNEKYDYPTWLELDDRQSTITRFNDLIGDSDALYTEICTKDWKNGVEVLKKYTKRRYNPAMFIFQ